MGRAGALARPPRPPGELVEAVSVPAAIGQERWGFAKLGPRNAMDWTQIAVSVVLSLDRSSGSIEQVRIGMNGVAPSALRARHAETALSGRTVTALDWPRITAALDRDIAPQGDVVFSERYKRHLASVLLKRAILKSFKIEADGKRDIQ